MNNGKEPREKFLEELNDKYRGERVYQTKRESLSGKKEEAFQEKDNFIWATGFDNKLYSHQKKIWEHINNGNNAYLLSPYFSGKSTIALLTSLKFLFHEAKSVLYLTSTKAEATIQQNIIKNLLKKLQFDWIIDPLLILHDNLAQVSLKKQMVPRLLITDISTLHYTLLPDHKNYKYLFEYLGLIVIDGFETFDASVRTNSAYVLRRFKRIVKHYANLPQYLITSRSFLEARDTLLRFIHVDEHEIELKGVFKDNREIHKADIEFWVPPIDDVSLDYSNNEWQSILTRMDFFEEAYSLIIAAVKNGLNSVILHYGVPFSKHDKNNKERLIDGAINNEIDNIGKYYIGTHPENLRAEMAEDGLDWDDINVIIFPGFEGSLMEIRDTILHIGNPKNTNVYIIFPQLPYYQFFVHHPEDLKLSSKAEDLRQEEHYPILPLDTEDNNIKMRHLIFFLNELPSNKEEIEKYFGKINNLQINDLISKENNKQILTKEGKDKVEKYIKEKGKDLNISSLESAYSVYVEGSDNKLCYVETFDVIHRFFPQAIVVINNTRYRVNRIENKNIFLRTEDIMSFTYPILRRMSLRFNEIEGTKYKFLEKVDVGLFSDSLKTTIAGYGSSKTLDIENTDFQEINEENLHNDTIEVSGFYLKINDNSSLVHTLSHLIFSSIISIFPRRGKGPYFYYNKDTIYFYDTASRSKGVFQALRNEQILKDIFERSWRILKDCPCYSGCPGCLKIFECEEKNNNLNKKETFKYLGELLGKEDITNKFITYKFEGVNDEVRLEELRKKIFEIYKYKCGIDFNEVNIYPEMFFSDQDLEYFEKKYGPLGGLCEKGKVWIIPGLKEENLIEVFSHEYCHNWQNGNVASSMQYFNIDDIDDTNNILYGCKSGFAKLFVEGQAVWASYKILDYYGLKKVIKSTRLSHYAEYNEGEKFVLFLEKELGIPFLLQFIKDGNPPNYEGKLMQYLNNKYDESGIDALILHQAIDKRNNGYLKCLGQEYLQKDRDLVRISYSLVLKSSQEPNSTKDLLEGNSKWLKDKIREKIENFINSDEVKEIDTNKIFNYVLEKIKAHIEPIVWKHFKEAITEVTGSEPELDELPCKTCKSAILETLEDTCILIKSISYATKIKKEIKDKIEEIIKNYKQ